MSMKKFAAPVAVAALLGVAGLLLGTGSASAQHEKEKDKEKDGAGHTKAVAVLFPTKDSKASGRVTFTKQGRKVRIARVGDAVVVSIKYNNRIFINTSRL